MKKQKTMKKSKLSVVLLLALCLILAVLTAGLSGTLVRASVPDHAENYTFNALQDEVFEDFDRVDVTDEVTPSGGATVLPESFFRADLVNPNPMPISHGTAALYGTAVGGFYDQISTRSFMGFRMRRPAGSTVSLSDLHLGLRPSNWAYAPIQWTVDSNGYVDTGHEQAVFVRFDQLNGSESFASEGRELSNDWQYFIVDLEESFVGLDFPATPAVGEAPARPAAQVALSNVMGFHLTSQGLTGESIDIERIFLAGTMAGANRQNITTFHGGATLAAMQANEFGAFWVNSNGTIHRRNVTLPQNGVVEIVNEANAATAFNYAVIQATGAVAGLRVQTTTDGGDTWSSEVALVHNALPLTGAVDGFRITNTGTATVTINRIFLTNFLVRQPDRNFPAIDEDSIFMIDNYADTQLSLHPYGHVGVIPPRESDPNSIIAGRFSPASLPGTSLNVQNGVLTMDSAAHDWMSMDFDIYGADQPNLAHHDFIVFRARTTNYASFANFRFNFRRTGAAASPVRWFNNGGDRVLAGYQFGTTANLGLNPYIDDGWVDLIVDINLTFPGFGTGLLSGMTLFWSGNDALIIDEIFLASRQTRDFTATITNRVEIGPYADDLPITMVAPAGADAAAANMWLGPYHGNNSPLLVLRMRAVTPGANLNTLRLDFWGAGTIYVVPGEGGNQIVDNNGELWRPLSTQSQYFVIDLYESGITNDIAGVAIWRNSLNGTVIIEDIFFADDVQIEYALFENFEVYGNPRTWNAPGPGHAWLGHFYINNPTNSPFLVFEMRGAVAGIDIADFRFELPGQGTVWVGHNNGAGRIVDNNGNYWGALTTTNQLFIIDLDALGIARRGFAHMHVHSYGTGGENVIVDRVFFASYYQIPTQSLPTLLPSVSINDTVLETGVAGTAIPVAFTAAGHGVTTAVTVRRGDTNIAVSANTFTPMTAGEYVVTVTTTDMFQRVATVTRTITTTLPAAPTVTIADTVPVTGHVGQTITVAFTATGTAPTTVVTVQRGEVNITLTDNAFDLTEVGDYLITVRTTDSFGRYVVATRTVVVTLPAAPLVTIAASVPTTAYTGETITVAFTASGTDVTSVVTVTRGETNITVTNNAFTVTEVGTYVITVTTTDAFGRYVTATRSVVVAEEVTGCKAMNVATYSAIGAVILLIGGLAILFVIKKKRKENA
ncbi:MAG: hypothetical protein FWE22_04665 [Firmicutes bacterium]|nr:hypothetical protein [Bacillota bacterium]